MSERTLFRSDRLWAIVSVVILGSIFIHGVAATPTMALLDRARRRRAQQSATETDVVNTPA